MKVVSMRRLFVAMAVALFASAGCGDGCSCDPPTKTDAGPGIGRLVISEPLHGATITPFDDQDPSTDGINLAVRVLGENMPDGTEVTLVNSAGGTIAPVRLNEGVALFEGVTFVAGDPPDGLVNQLTVSAGSYQGDSVSVTVIGESQAQCRFITSADLW